MALTSRSLLALQQLEFMMSPYEIWSDAQGGSLHMFSNAKQSSPYLKSNKYNLGETCQNRLSITMSTIILKINILLVCLNSI